MAKNANTERSNKLSSAMARCKRPELGLQEVFLKASAAGFVLEEESKSFPFIFKELDHIEKEIEKLLTEKLKHLEWLNLLSKEITARSKEQAFGDQS